MVFSLGFWVLDFGFWVLGFGILGFGFWILGLGFWNLKGLGLKFTGFNIIRSRQWVIAEDESCRGFTRSDVPKRLSDRSLGA